jgi:glycosyltransferase involved in cell wall biosynthesis
MTILLLADIGSSHTEKWALGLASRGIKIGLFSFNHSPRNWYEGNENILVLFQPEARIRRIDIFRKLGYLRFLPILRSKIKQFKPDILHAHYASSYGFLGSLSSFHPFVLSLWGSDVYAFPKKGVLNRNLLKMVLKNADEICSTSRVMSIEMSHYTTRNAHVIPFGVDTEHFRRKSFNKSGPFVFGTVKALEHIYGIDRLLRSFAVFLDLSNVDAVLHIYGSGSQEQNLKTLSETLGIEEKVSFKGFVSGDDLKAAYQNIDVFMALSRSESFGVAVLEASSMELPVITSNVGGFVEVVSNGETGFLVDGENSEDIVSKMMLLSENVELRFKMGQNGRFWVMERFNFESNLSSQIELYKEVKKENE